MALGSRFKRVVWGGLFPASGPGHFLCAARAGPVAPFHLSHASRVFQDKAHIILVNTSCRRPVNAQAEANLDGRQRGGGAPGHHPPAAFTPPAGGSELEQSRQRQRQLEAQQQRLLSELKSKTVAPRKESPEPQPQPVPAPVLSAGTWPAVPWPWPAWRPRWPNVANEQTSARARKISAPGPMNTASPSTWRNRRLEGRAHRPSIIPEAARASSWPSGAVGYHQCRRQRGAGRAGAHFGQKVRDEAALRSSAWPAPDPPFPADIRREVDQLVITRTWSSPAAIRSRRAGRRSPCRPVRWRFGKHFTSREKQVFDDLLLTLFSEPHRPQQVAPIMGCSPRPRPRT